MHPLKHHYIPQFYLKQWANLPDHRICEFSRPHTAVVPRRTAPAGTGYVERLYALRGFPEDLAQQVEEQFFSTMDNGASETLKKLIDDGSSANLTVEQRSAWSRFLVSLLSRTPEDVETFRQVWTEHVSDVAPELEAEYAALRSEGDPLTLAEAMALRPQEQQEKELFQALTGVMDNPSLGGKLNGQPFKVLSFPETAPELLTSDRPVVRNHDGLAQPGGHLAIAIGPRQLFVTSLDANFMRALENVRRDELAHQMNLAVVKHARKYVYGRTDASIDFVREHFATVDEPRLISREMLERMRKRKAQARRAIQSEGWHALLATNIGGSR